MRKATLSAIVFLGLAAPAAAAKCIPIHEARERVGANVCVTGKVVKVAKSDSGVHFLNFCEDYKTCPFAAVVFPNDLRQVGDVRWLEGRTVELHGIVQLYRGQPEIVLRDARQLKGEAAKLPAVPKTYDVARQGRFSAGTFPRSKASKQPKSKKAKRPSGRAAPSSEEEPPEN